MTMGQRGGWGLKSVALLVASLLLVGCGAIVSHGAASASSSHRSARRRGPFGSPRILQAIQMATPQAGAAVSLSMLYQTHDGGQVWTPVQPINEDATLFTGPQQSLLLVSVRSGTGSRLQLTTGWWRVGHRWRFQTALLTLAIQTGGGIPGVPCSLRTPTAAWCLFTGGGGMQRDATQLWQTVNAGATWTPLGTTETPPGTAAYGMKGAPVWTTPEDGWMPSTVFVTRAGTPEGPVLYQTTDGGTVWTTVSVPPPSFSGPPGTFTVSSLSAVPGGPTWIALATAANADATATRVTVLRAQGPNAAWKPVGHALKVAGVVSVAHLFAVSSRVWWLWTGDGLYRTTDAAQSWVPEPLPARLRAALHSDHVGYSADFLGSSTGWILLQYPNPSNMLWHLDSRGWSALIPRVLSPQHG
jgi:hypothetical protein